MTWGARYSGAPRPTNERAEVSGYQPARTDPPLLGREELSVPSAPRAAGENEAAFVREMGK